MSEPEKIPPVAAEVGPAGDSGIAREEVIRIHHALRDILRQLSQHPYRQLVLTVSESSKR